MKIHYFQRYSQKENVATANAMLLLSRLYSYSTDKFFRVLSSEILSGFDPQIDFTIQAKGKKSVPDAVISQESFKIIVETKMSDWFYTDQLERHLNSFGNEKKKVLLTLAPEEMKKETKDSFEGYLVAYNASQIYPVSHVNTTFKKLVETIAEVLDDRDFEMRDILDDFENYCYEDNLIPLNDEWKYMRVQLAGKSFDYNFQKGIYYDNAKHGFRPHDYLGLYKDKKVAAVGKVIARINAVETSPGEVEFEKDFGEITQVRKDAIINAMDDAKMKGWDLKTVKHKYFFVDSFHETEFKKTSPRAPMGSRIFNLEEVFGEGKVPNNAKNLAEQLKGKNWQ